MVRPKLDRRVSEAKPTFIIFLEVEVASKNNGYLVGANKASLHTQQLVFLNTLRPARDQVNVDDI